MSTQPRHYKVTILLHWLSFFLMLIAIGSVLTRELIEDDSLRSSFLILHKSTGFAFLWVSLLRIALRCFYYSDGTLNLIPNNLRLIAKASHLLIYMLLIAVPMSGWLFVSAAGKPVIFFGLLPIPSLMSKNRELAETLGSAHQFFAWLLVVLIISHVAAALWHHFIRKDQVLLSMTLSKQER